MVARDLLGQSINPMDIIEPPTPNKTPTPEKGENPKNSKKNPPDDGPNRPNENILNSVPEDWDNTTLMAEETQKFVRREELKKEKFLLQDQLYTRRFTGFLPPIDKVECLDYQRLIKTALCDDGWPVQDRYPDVYEWYIESTKEEQDLEDDIDDMEIDERLNQAKETERTRKQNKHKKDKAFISRHIDSNSESSEYMHTELDDAITDQHFPRFLFIKGVQEFDFNKMDAFSIEKAIYGIVGSHVKDVKPIRAGHLLVEVDKASHARSLLSASIFNNVQVTVEQHSNLNSKKGVVRQGGCLRSLSEEEIAFEINRSNPTVRVTDVHNIKSGPNKEPTSIYILTFFGTSLPDKIKAGYNSLPVVPYVQKPQQCFKCQKYGHQKKFCKNNAVCAHCGGDHSVDEKICDQKAEPKCANCQGAHKSNSNKCPMYVKQQNILKIRNEDNSSFKQAALKYEKLNPTQPTLSAADVVRGVGSTHAAPTVCTNCHKSTDGVSIMSYLDFAIQHLQKMKSQVTQTNSPTSVTQNKKAPPKKSNDKKNPIKSTKASAQTNSSQKPSAPKTSSVPKTSSAIQPLMSVKTAAVPSSSNVSGQSSSGPPPNSQSVDKEVAGSSSPTPPSKRTKVDESGSPPAPVASQPSNKEKLKMKSRELRNNRTGHTPGFSGVPG